MNNIHKGQNAEDQAAAYLTGKGFTILQRNYALKGNRHGGEIDIIALKGETVHFIEVKARTTDTYGMGRESVRYTKQRTIRRLATHYLVTNKLYDEVHVSLDIIEITRGELEHLENCF